MITQQILNRKSKVKMTGNAPADGITKDVQIIVPLNYLRDFEQVQADLQ